jgi:hypothetical protein
MKKEDIEAGIVITVESFIGKTGNPLVISEHLANVVERRFPKAWEGIKDKVIIDRRYLSVIVRKDERRSCKD